MFMYIYGGLKPYLCLRQVMAHAGSTLHIQPHGV